MILGALALILTLCVLASSIAIVDSDNSENNVTLGNQSLPDGTVLSDDSKTLITAPPNAVDYIIPDTVETVAGYAFFKCNSIKSITFPSSVTTLEAKTFDGLGQVSLYIPLDATYMDQVPPFFNIYRTPPANDPLTYKYDETALTASVSGCDTSATSVVIPDTVILDGKKYSVTSIGYYAFKGCYSLTSVTIPDSVTSIGENAFYSCYKLTSITIPDGVTLIERSTFADCSSLTSITIPDSVTSIKDYAFSGCSSLTSINIPNSVTWIGSYVFKDCTALTSITIPDSVRSFGAYAFKNCTALASITIPNSVTIIANYAFSGCSSLTSITIPDGVTSINDYIFEGCTALTSINIPDGVTSIGSYTFSGCSSLTSINIPNSVTSIGGSAFYNCSSLTSINIPDSVTSINDYIFKDCTALTSITIPDGVTSIGSSAFYNCSSLTSITIPDGVTTIGLYVFEGCTALTSITFEHKGTLPTFMSGIYGSDSLDTKTETDVYLDPSIYETESANNFPSFRKTYTSPTVLKFHPLNTAVELTFNTNGGSETASQTIDYNTIPVRPAEPTKNGFVFAGWYTDEELTSEYAFTTPLTENTTLYAKWSEKLVFTTIPTASNVTVTVDGRTITATVVADNYEYLLWDMGDGSEPVKTYTNSIAYTYSSDGDYTVKVTAYNSKGQSETISQDISVSEGDSDKGSSSDGSNIIMTAGIVLLIIGAILLIITKIKFNYYTLGLGLFLFVAGVVSLIGGLL